MSMPRSKRDEAQRIAGIAQRFLQHSFFPLPFTHTITAYLMGEAVLANVKQALREAILTGGAGIYLDFPLFALEGMSAGPDAPLDAYDLHILDLFILAGHVDVFLINNRERDMIAQVHQRLQGSGMNEQAILKLFCLAAPYAAFDPDHKIMPLGRYLLSFVPEKLGGLPRGRQYDYSFPYDIRLFLAKQPPALDLAWQEVQYIADDDSDYYNHSFGLCVSLLLQADAARFIPWARQVAGPASTVNEVKRLGALQALIDHDPTQHLDLAVEAVRAPITQPASTALQCAGLKAAYRFDPKRAWPLLEEVILSQSSLAMCAVELLSDAPMQQARPLLQRCIAEGYSEAALLALEPLLAQRWQRKSPYMASLLAHRSRQIRTRAGTWLSNQGSKSVELVTPYLSHSHAETRLAAINVLRKLRSPEAAALLRARLEEEPVQRVRRALLKAQNNDQTSGPHSDTVAAPTS